MPDMSDIYRMAWSFMSMLWIQIKDETKKHEVQKATEESFGQAKSKYHAITNLYLNYKAFANSSARSYV
ncbi:MAG: hypothetical protein ACRD8Z_09550 [Nitrososphaeraceae archaeon]|jgi:hypothetical protein